MNDKQYWTTKKGYKILISSMTDSHLTNTVRMLTNSNWVHSSIWISCARYAATTGGEMAADAAEEALHSMKTSASTDGIFEEFNRRNLKL